MKKITIILSLLFFSIGSLFAQLQSAYFQQEVNYKIDVRLDDTLHFLHGHETIEYKNNSHETINYIYFHLWPNAYK
ncbi:MAG TPA: peptidase, partial [Flavobacteriales bacterium]|nr:peptidase [Flavobacteriales bacterium]